MSQDIVQDIWNERTAWSIAADKLKASREFWRSAALILTVVGAASQTLASTAPDLRKPVGLVGALSLAMVPFITARLLTPERTSKWLRARSVSEGIKSEVYIFRAGADPYTGSDALEKLRRKVWDIQSWGKGLEIERARVNPPVNVPPPGLDPDGYMEKRVNQQIAKYYSPKAKLNANRAVQFQVAETVLTAIAALLGAYASFAKSNAFGPWVAVLTTVGGALAAHAAAGRYDFQATTFYATARQLEDLAQGWQISGKSAPSKEWSDFVNACEQAISAENRGWMAKLDQKS